jgi:hypothetical protein
MDESDNARSVTLMRGYESERYASQGLGGGHLHRRWSRTIPVGDAHAVDPGEQHVSLCGKAVPKIEGLWPPGSMERGCPACVLAAGRYGQRVDI